MTSSTAGSNDSSSTAKSPFAQPAYSRRTSSTFSCGIAAQYPDEPRDAPEDFSLGRKRQSSRPRKTRSDRPVEWGHAHLRLGRAAAVAAELASLLTLEVERGQTPTTRPSPGTSRRLGRRRSS